ncbi:MAG: hypothetical protein QF464_03200, partial [Myxococcota bacterium]|nr:hypothetical protein [Myxococcota bacterium]
MTRALPLIGSVLGALILYGCHEPPPVAPIATVAERFVSDLGAPDGEALSGWFRARSAASVRRVLGRLAALLCLPGSAVVHGLDCGRPTGPRRTA